MSGAIRPGAVALLLLAPTIVGAAEAPGPMQQAIHATITNNLTSRGIDPTTGYGLATIQNIDAILDTMGNVGTGWAKIMETLFPQGSQIGEPHTGFGGGGASGSWEAADPCGNLTYNADVSGNLIVPAIPPSAGGAMDIGATVYFPSTNVGASVPTTPGNSNYYVLASSPAAAQLRQLHLKNVALGSDKRYWMGIYKVIGNETYYSRLGSYNGSTLIGPLSSSNGIGGVKMMGPPNATKACPQLNGGGDFHFYIDPVTGDQLVASNGQQSLTQCVWYAPNPSLGASGYAYPERAMWPKADLGLFPNGSTLASCEISKSAIARIVAGAWKQAAAVPGYSGVAAPQTIEPTAVKGGDTWPKVSDLNKPATTPLAAPTSTTPATGPTPTPTTTTPTTTPGPDYTDPKVGEPNPTAPTLSMPDWFPDLPSFSVPTGSGTCPTWTFEAFDHSYTVDSHCPLIESARPAIAAIMIVIFTVVAGLIVLKA